MDKGFINVMEEIVTTLVNVIDDESRLSNILSLSKMQK